MGWKLGVLKTCIPGWSASIFLAYLLHFIREYKEEFPQGVVMASSFSSLIWYIHCTLLK